MNRKYTLLGLLLIFYLPTYSQIGELYNNWAIGINGGVNLNKVSFESSPRIKQKYLIGPTGGVTVRYISEKYFAMICGIQMELNYAQRGWSEDTEEKPYSYSRTMNYFEVPLLAHLAFGKDRGVQFFVNAGPQMGYLISEKEKREGQWESYSAEQYGKIAENKFDYGIVGGGGLEIRTGAGHFLLEGRYYFGLADFFNSTKKDYFSRSAHTTISVRLTYLFDIVK